MNYRASSVPSKQLWPSSCLLNASACLTSLASRLKMKSVHSFSQTKAFTIYDFRHDLLDLEKVSFFTNLFLFVGVVLLHLLLIPGVAFLAGGTRIWHQHLNPHSTQLNHSLLTVGYGCVMDFFTMTKCSFRILALLIPTALFAALNPGIDSSGETTFLTDDLKDKFVRFSRGLAILLLLM